MPFTAQHIKAGRLKLQKSDPTLKKIMKRVGPFTATTRRDRFATLVRSIVSQQISTAAARTILERLELALGKGKLKRGQTYNASRVLKFSVDELRELGVSRQKATYLLDLAANVDAGTLDLKTIHKLDNEAAIEALIQVKGIGRWTAQMFLMFSLGRLDIFPVDDLGIRNAIETNYGFKEAPTCEEMNEIAENWQPYATIASWYLWQSLELE